MDLSTLTMDLVLVLLLLGMLVPVTVMVAVEHHKLVVMIQMMALQVVEVVNKGWKRPWELKSRERPGERWPFKSWERSPVEAKPKWLILITMIDAMARVNLSRNERFFTIISS
ncbi:hypothetical protein ACH5RR_009691 [Cinchona calisaya]|uniref:Secreted protein n=1 Tax=Cinchona calisaya TaxID=153742 RepID=A0ABD3AF39_9GENT